MGLIKKIICPNCKTKTLLLWWKEVGVYRGYCRYCRKLMYCREYGEAWINQEYNPIQKKTRTKPTFQKHRKRRK